MFELGHCGAGHATRRILAACVNTQSSKPSARFSARSCPTHDTIALIRLRASRGTIVQNGATAGPFMLGLLTELSGSQRVGVSIVILLFLLGLAALGLVDEREGMRQRTPSS